jgi:hypothetical protein
MHTISYILVVIIALIFLYTAIYGCGCNKNESFETEYKTNTKTVAEVKKKINSAMA